MNTPWITAHSGCEQLPKDSLASVDCALELQADAAELDVRRTRDGRLYISHNACTGEEIAQRITLEQVFDRIRGTGLRMNCDIKEAFAVSSTLDLADSCGIPREQLILTGAVSAETLAMEPWITERAQVFLNMEEALKYFRVSEFFREKNDDQFATLMTGGLPLTQDLLQQEAYVEYLIRFVKNLHVSGINMPHIFLTDSIIQRFRQEEIACSVWTVNEEADINRCLELQVFNITTRAVRRTMKCRKLWMQHRAH